MRRCRGCQRRFWPTRGDLDYRGLPSPAMAVDDLASRFGCFEMEIAAERIITRCRRRGHWAIVMGISDFADDEYVLLGFVMLCAYQWIIPRDVPNWAFRLGRTFIIRVTEKA